MDFNAINIAKNRLPGLLPSICALLFTMNSFAQFKIAGMQRNGQTAYEADATILEPGKQPYGPPIQFDPAIEYPFGTTITTNQTEITTIYRGQIQVIRTNSALKFIKEQHGVKAQTVKGIVDHFLKNVKQSVGIYKAGNGFTWAHADGTDFRVEVGGQSKNVKIATSEGNVTIIDQVPVTISQSATTNIGGKRDSELTTAVRTENTAGEEYTTRQRTNPLVYPTYEAAIAAFEQATYESEQSGTAYVEELAENYGLIGELYMSVGQFELALEPLEKAVEYLSSLDPEDLYIIDTSLYYCEALLRADDPDYNSLGNELLVDIINILLPELNDYLNEYNYALQYQDEDWAWDLCFDLVDINEYLGWSYELLNDIPKAGEYYNWANQYESRL